jgi:hypothetical protein
MKKINFSPQALRLIEKKHLGDFLFDDSGGGHLAPTLDAGISGHDR